MTNEVGSGLGVRQPAGPIGGTAPFGVIKLAFTGQNFNAMGGPSPTLGKFGKVLQTVALGVMTKDLSVLVWTTSVRVVITATGGAVRLLVNVRDATVQPTITDAQFADAIAPLIPSMVGVTPIGTNAYDANLVNGPSIVGQQNQFNVDIANAKTDNYGNTIKTGDAIALDFGLITSTPLPVGTYDATAWVTAMFS